MTVAEIDKEIERLKELRQSLVGFMKKEKENEQKNIHRLLLSVKWLMIINNIGYKDIADKIGVSKQSVWKWVNFDKPIPVNRAKQIGKLFNWDI